MSVLDSYAIGMRADADRCVFDTHSVQAAKHLLAELPVGTGRLVIDLSATRTIDSAGLGALMLIQRMAAERRQTVVLRAPSEEIRFLLVLTKLADLFDIDDDS